MGEMKAVKKQPTVFNSNSVTAELLEGGGGKARPLIASQQVGGQTGGRVQGRADGRGATRKNTAACCSTKAQLSPASPSGSRMCCDTSAAREF